MGNNILCQLCLFYSWERDDDNLYVKVINGFLMRSLPSVHLIFNLIFPFLQYAEK